MLNSQDQTALHTDVLIIGAGAVGSVYARLLVDAGRKVTMIDAGKQLSVQPGEHQKNAFRYQQYPNLFAAFVASQLETYSVSQHIFSRIQHGSQRNFENPEQKWYRNMPFASAVYAVGGMLTVWSGAAPNPELWERTPLLSADDWEIALAVARKLLNVHTDVFDHSQVGKAVKSRLIESGYHPEPLPLAVENVFQEGLHSNPYFVKWTGTDTILGSLILKPEYKARFQLLAEHRAESLSYKGSKVEAAVVRDLKTFTLKKIWADTVIVTSGSFLTPRLLWMSGICYEALGRYLHDHLTVSCSISLGKRVLEHIKDTSVHKDHNQEKISVNDPGPALMFPSTAERPWLGKVTRLGEKLMYFPTGDLRKLVQFTWYGTVDVARDNRITFSSRYKDRFDMPQITIDYRYSWADLKRMISMFFDLLQRAFKVGSLAGAPIISPAGTSQHLLGTYRMGDDEDEKTSVVDSYGKVWGFDNLYLGGLGIIPNRTASNPTLTISAIAVRSAARLLNCSLEEIRQSVNIPQ